MRVVGRSRQWVVQECTTNNDDLFKAIFYLSGAQCMRCYAGFSAVFEILTTNNDDIFRAIYDRIGP